MYETVCVLTYVCISVCVSVSQNVVGSRTGGSNNSPPNQAAGRLGTRLPENPTTLTKQQRTIEKASKTGSGSLQRASDRSSLGLLDAYWLKRPIGLYQGLPSRQARTTAPVGCKNNEGTEHGPLGLSISCLPQVEVKVPPEGGLEGGFWTLTIHLGVPGRGLERQGPSLQPPPISPCT